MRALPSTGLRLAALLALSACGSGGGREGQGNAVGPDAPASGAELAEDADLANQAAAAEALDAELYGGNAAAGETGNATTVRTPTNTPAEPRAESTPAEQGSPGTR